MRANENTAIVQGDLVLVPYREAHVAKYHDWMLSPELRELTASELLSLEEEYEMQRKWQTDEDKLTFIICTRNDDSSSRLSDDYLAEKTSLTMIGDVNLFLKGPPDDEDFEAEVEIMIAEPAHRRRGFALTALQLMLSYATSSTSPSPLPVQRDKLVARIGEKNLSSIRLFDKLGFVIVKRIAVFQEVEMRFRGKPDSEPWSEGLVKSYPARDSV